VVIILCISGTRFSGQNLLFRAISMGFDANYLSFGVKEYHLSNNKVTA